MALPSPAGRYPDVAAVIPKRRDHAAGGIDEADARELLTRLPTLPGHADPHRPITLALDGGVTVLARGGEAVAEVPMQHSTAAGPAARVALDRALRAADD